MFIIAAIFTVIIIFSSKRLSPIPYFPSQKVDLPLIIKSLDLKNDQAIIDLGAGDGIVIFEAAKKAKEKNLNTQFVAVEINPILILILYLRRFFHSNKKNVKVVRSDMFKLSLRAFTKQFHYYKIASSFTPFAPRNDSETMKQFNNVTIYLYISPWFLDKVAKKILHEFPKARIISYMYPIKSLKNKQRIIPGKNQIYIY